GGYSYLGELWQVGSSNALHYAEIVRNKATLRALMHVSMEILNDATNETGAPDDLLERAEQQVLAIEDKRLRDDSCTTEDMAQDFYQRIDDRCRDKKLRGLKTGFADIDAITVGLQQSELIILAARPSVGKTSLALNIASHAFFEDKVPVLLISLEQSREELFEREACHQARVDSHALRKGILRPCYGDEPSDGDKLHNAAQRLRKAPWFVSDTPGQTMLKIAAKARRHRLRHGIGLLVVDYLQLVEPENRRESRYEQVGVISRRLK